MMTSGLTDLVQPVVIVFVLVLLSTLYVYYCYKSSVRPFFLKKSHMCTWYKGLCTVNVASPLLFKFDCELDNSLIHTTQPSRTTCVIQYLCVFTML